MWKSDAGRLGTGEESNKPQASGLISNVNLGQNGGLIPPLPQVSRVRWDVWQILRRILRWLMLNDEDVYVVRCLVIMHHHTVMRLATPARWWICLNESSKQCRVSIGFNYYMYPTLHRMALSPARGKFTIGPAGSGKDQWNHLDTITNIMQARGGVGLDTPVLSWHVILTQCYAPQLYRHLRHGG